MEYRNPPTVVVGLVRVFEDNYPAPGRTGLLVIRRGLEDGYGKLALPGGYQEEGETWQKALSREVTEETGLEDFDHVDWSPVNVVTVQDGKINLLFAEDRTGKGLVVLSDAFPYKLEDNDETLEVDVIYKPTELAFPTHTAEANAWFQRKSLEENVW